jgi:DNA-binding MarR family transcriptional regulator
VLTPAIVPPSAARIKPPPTPPSRSILADERPQPVKELDALLRPHGLTFARYEALVLLSFSRDGALPMRIIGERLMVHPTSVTNTIDRLEQQKLVVRRPNPRDGRGTLAEITEAGRSVMRAATDDLMTAEFGMAGYSPRQLEDMSSLLRGLRVTAGDFKES